MRALLPLLVAIPLAIAGCVAPPDEPVDTAAIEAAAQIDENVWVEEPFSFEGSFGPGAHVCPVFFCFGGSPGTESSTELEIEGALRELNMTLTWESESPAMDAMYLWFYWETEDEYDSIETEGTSPLVLEALDLDIPAGATYYVGAWPVSDVPMGAAQATTPQSFVLEGTTVSETGGMDEEAPDAE